MYSTLEVPYGNPSGNFLGVHFSPIMYLILPFYALFQSPQFLLIFQSFILAIAALPLYWLARDKLGNKLYALAFATIYLLNPALHGVNTFDFHLEIFTPVFFLFAFYYLEKGEWYKAVPFMILELTTLEFAPFIVFSLGLYFFLKKIMEGYRKKQPNLTIAKRLAIPMIIMIGSICSFYIALQVVSSINPLKSKGPYRNWGYWGENVFEALGNMVRNPGEIIIMLFTPIEKTYFIIFLFSSVLFLPLLAPLELIMSFPWLLAALLTDYQPYYQPYFQYTVLALGQIFIAAVYGFQRLLSQKHTNSTNNKNSSQKKAIVMMMTLNLFLYATISPVGISAFTNRSIRPYAIGIDVDFNHVNKVHEALGLIPLNASVATIHDLFPHLCQRLHAYFLKWPLDYDVEYIIVDVKSPTFAWGIYGLTPDEIVIKLLEDKEYGISVSIDGVLILKKGYTGSVQLYSPQVDVFNYNHLIPSSGKTKWDYTSTSRKIITSDPINSLGVVWFGPYEYFVPGKYSAIFRIRATNETCQLLLDVATKQASLSIAQRIVNGTEFIQLNDWQDFSVHFEIDKPTKLEFRGICLSNNTQVAIDYIIVEQLEP